MINPLLTLDHAYTLLLQDENQREVFANAQFSSESASFIVRKQGRKIQKTVKPIQRNAFSLQRLRYFSLQRVRNQLYKGKTNKTLSFYLLLH